MVGLSRLRWGNGPVWLPAAQRQRAERTYCGAREREPRMEMKTGKQRNSVHAAGVEMVQQLYSHVGKGAVKALQHCENQL